MLIKACQFGTQGKLILLLALLSTPLHAQISHLQGDMSGEVTANSVLLQSRLTGTALGPDGDVPGAQGVACFEIAENEKFEGGIRTAWIQAVPEYDFIIKSKVADLKPATRYYYRLLFGPDPNQIQQGPVRTFRTLPTPDGVERTSVMVVTGMNHAFFYNGRDGKGTGAYRGDDRHLGFPGLASMLQLKPDFFVGTGDNVYYDHPVATRATTPAAMRRKWHEQFVQPRFVELFAQVPTYWEKDDHDHRYDDSDPYGDRLPSHELGVRLFREQVPVVDPLDEKAVTYRTHRLSKLLQIWLLEGRDYRSPNAMPPSPEKSIWGAEQKAWLKQTLRDSDAPFKIVISPTPMVGPDRESKRDNHVNSRGFRHEGEEFFAWAKEQGMYEKGLYLVCGDRHWQYHSIHPSGAEEFSCGALVEANAIVGTFPGEQGSNDPEGKILQPYHPRTAHGGFLNIVVEPGQGESATCEFRFYDEQGNLQYTAAKQR